MEFKEPNQYDKGRPKITVPERGDATPVEPFSVRRPGVVNKPATKTPGIHIHFGPLPSKSAIIATVRQIPLTRKAVIIGGLIVITAGLVVTWSLVNQQQITTHSATTNPHVAVDNVEYQTVLPANKSISDLGGWKRISPAKSDPVYAYADKIGTVAISVSQQPLPPSFKSDVDNKVAELAKKFNATDQLDVGDTKAYVGTSSQGPQSTILTRNGLLILIKSETKITDKDWISYIKSLN